MRKAVIILLLSLLAYAVHAQTFELDEETLDLDPDDPFFFLIIQNILTLDIPCTVSRMPEYGIYEFFNRFVSPPNVCIFLKSGNVCEILAMAPLMGLDVLESPGIWLDYQLDTRYLPTSTQRISLSRFQ